MVGLSKFARERRRVAFVGVIGATLATVVFAAWTGVAARTQSGAPGRTGPAGFLQEGRCYRLTFAITGTPDWKVLEVRDGGWIRAEADAGSSSARRESAWINTGQVVTIRDKACAP